MIELDLSRISVMLESSAAEKKSTGVACCLSEIEQKVLENRLSLVEAENQDLKSELEAEKKRMDTIVSKIISSSNLDARIEDFLRILNRTEISDLSIPEPKEEVKYVDNTEELLYQLKQTHRSETDQLKEHFRTELSKKIEMIEQLQSKLVRLDDISIDCEGCSYLTQQREETEEKLKEAEETVEKLKEELSIALERADEAEAELEYSKWMQGREIQLLKKQIKNEDNAEMKEALSEAKNEVERLQNEVNKRDLELKRASDSISAREIEDLRNELMVLTQRYEEEVNRLEEKWEDRLEKEKMEFHRKFREVERRAENKEKSLKSEHEQKVKQLYDLTEKLGAENKALTCQYLKEKPEQSTWKSKMEEVHANTEKYLTNIKEFYEKEKTQLRMRIGSLENRLQSKRYDSEDSPVKQKKPKRYLNGCISYN